LAYSQRKNLEAIILERVNAMSQRTVVTVLVLLVGSVPVAAIGQAQQLAPGMGPGNLKIGQLEVHGELSQQVTFDDNIFIEHEDETSDVIFVTTPTVNFMLPGERLNGNVYYSVGLRAFADNDQENSQNHTLSAAMAYRTPRGNFIRIQDTYLDTTDLSTSEEQSNIAPRTEWHSNQVRTTLGLPELPTLERIDLELGHFYETRYFERVENSTEDYDRNQVSVRWYYDVSPFLPKTRFLVEYIFGIVKYDKGELVRRDADYHIVRTGVSIEPTAKLSGMATAGAEFRSWDYPPAGRTETEDMTLFNVRTDLHYRYGIEEAVGEVGSINLTVLREIRESAFRFLERIEPVVEVTRVEVGVQHRFNLPAGNITLPLTLLGNFFYEFEEFPGIVTDPATGITAEREDDFMGGAVRVRLDGRIPNANLNYFASLGYEVHDRDSNFNLKDYTANRVSLLFGVNF